MDSSETLVDEIRENLGEPFITATCAALGEMAGVEVGVRDVHREALDGSVDDIAVVVDLTSARQGRMALIFPRHTAAALARRVLTGLAEELDEAMIRDCLGEIANVVAGQAKALLADTPYRFTVSLPRAVLRTELKVATSSQANCLVIALNSEAGPFALHLDFRAP